MGGLLDLLFFGLLLWFVLRAARRASGQMRQRSEGRAEAPEAGRRPTLETGRRPTPDAESPVRRRLMEELQRWEVEQQAREVERREADQRGGQVERRRWGPAGAPPVPAGRELEPPGAWQEETLETVPPVEGWSLERARPDAREVSTIAAPRVSESVARAEAGGPAVPRRSRRAGGGLPDLSRYTPTQRAVLWAEILGPPPGLGEARRD